MSGNSMEQQLAERRQSHAKSTFIPTPPEDSDIEIVSSDDVPPNMNNTHNNIHNRNRHQSIEQERDIQRIQHLKNCITNKEKKIIRYTTDISRMEAEVLALEHKTSNSGKMEDIEDDDINVHFNEDHKINTIDYHSPPHSFNNNSSQSKSTPNLIRKERERIAAQEKFDREIAKNLHDRYARESEDELHQQSRDQQRQRQMRQTSFNEWQPNYNSFIDQQSQRQSFPRSFSQYSSSTISYNNNGSSIPSTVHYSTSNTGHQPPNIASNDARNFFIGNEFMNNNSNFQRLMNSSGFQHPMMNNMMMDMGMGMPFGGMLNLDDMSYEQMQQLFPNVPRGANEESIQNLPTDKYRETSPSVKDVNINNNNMSNYEKKEKSKGDKCCICLEEFKTGEDIRRLPCMHIFHLEEIDHWLRINHVCPICRIAVDGVDANAHE